MCAISGLFGEDAGLKILTMLEVLKHRGPDGSGIYVDGHLTIGSLEELSREDGNLALGHNLLSIVGSDVQQPLLGDGNILVSNAEIYNYEEIKSCLDYDFKTNSDCEVILALLKEKDQGELSETIPLVLDCLEGDYAFVVYDGNDWTAVRDPVGVKPLFFGTQEKTGLFGIASERKALWKIGITNVSSLNPGNMIYNREIVPLEKRRGWIRSSKIFRINDPLIKIREQLNKLITESVRKRVAGLDKVGIIFSGGVDSTILAQICKKLGYETELYTVGKYNSPDIQFSHKAAELMGLPLHTRLVDEELVRASTTPVLQAIEEWNIMKIGVGMTAYLASQMASKHGFKVLLSGQGADELFGGYHRYQGIYEEKGEIAQDDLEGDIKNIYSVNLERDDAVTMAHSVELRVPYMDLQVINRAMNIPMMYKIRKNNDQLRKCILREVALDLDVPREIAYRPKKAAQYGSGIHQLLVKKVLKDDSFTNKVKKSVPHIINY
jgi:asparagine synthase (glutamine-hydrolysing)